MVPCKVCDYQLSGLGVGWSSGFKSLGDSVSADGFKVPAFKRF